MGHLYHGYVSHNQMVINYYIPQNWLIFDPKSPSIPCTELPTVAGMPTAGLARGDTPAIRHGDHGEMRRI